MHKDASLFLWEHQVALSDIWHKNYSELFREFVITYDYKIDHYAAVRMFAGQNCYGKEYKTIICGNFWSKYNETFFYNSKNCTMCIRDLK